MMNPDDKWVVSWEYNGKRYQMGFRSYIQAMVKYWQLEGNNSRAISERNI